MKRFLIALLLLSPLLQAANPFGKPTPNGWSADLVHTPDPDLEKVPVVSFFSPDERGTQAIVDQLNGAKRQVLVQAFSSFTSTPIDRALVDAHKRGVDVQVILDKSSEMYSSATFLANEGVPTYIDPVHRIVHNTLMVIDEKTVITVSFNFTKSAEQRSFFNFLKSAARRLFDKPDPFGDCFTGPALIINTNPEFATRSTADWKQHLGHSEPYKTKN
jgi:phosphatidylserine/phosphatidylglycerophosphate/cardiolipin synthase-like enzyme